MKYRLSFCKRIMALAVFLLLSFSPTIVSKTCIDLTRGGIPQLLDSMWESKLVIKDGVPETITQPGVYHLLENLSTEILIDADNVVIDLNGFTLSGDTDTIITVSSNEHYNILIKNGSIKGNNANTGIKVDENTSGVVLQDLHFSDLNIGVNFDGTSELPVKCSKVDNCFTTSCVKAYALDNVVNSVFQENEICCCREAGFDMFECMHNKIKNCMVVGVSNDDVEVGAVGYKTKDGIDNLFYECFAEQIYKDAGNWCTNAIGFMFTGSERESKIVDCLVDTLMSSSWTNSFGIYLDMMLRDSNDFVNEDAFAFDTSDEGGIEYNITDIAWSPRCEYLATAESNDNSYNVYKFDPIKKKIKFIDGDGFNDASVNAVAWSYDGKYLAAVKDFDVDPNGREIIVFDVDTLTQSSLDNSQLIDDGNQHSFTDVAWFHHSHKFAAVAKYDNGADLHVFNFDPVTKVITDVKRVEVVDSTIGNEKLVVAISPDDKFISVGSFDGTVEIYHSVDLEEVAIIDTLVAAQVNSLDWNPVACCGRYYLVIGGDFILQVWDWRYNSDPVELAGPSTFEKNALTVKWHPTGKYFIVSGGSDETQDSAFVEFYTFNPQALTDQYELLVAKGAGFNLANATYVDWSPCAKYFIAAGTSSEVSENLNINMQVFEVGYGVTKCLVDHNKVANCSSDLCSIGFFGATGCNCFTRNVGYENCINFSEGIYNVFYNGLAGPHGPQGNWSIPPY